MDNRFCDEHTKRIAILDKEVNELKVSVARIEENTKTIRNISVEISPKLDIIKDKLLNIAPQVSRNTLCIDWILKGSITLIITGVCGGLITLVITYIK